MECEGTCANGLRCRNRPTRNNFCMRHASQCLAQTKQGNRCRMNVVDGWYICHVHIMRILKDLVVVDVNSHRLPYGVFDTS